MDNDKRQLIFDVINELSSQGCEVMFDEGKIHVYTEHRDANEEDYDEDMAKNLVIIEELFKKIGI